MTATYIRTTFTAKSEPRIQIVIDLFPAIGNCITRNSPILKGGVKVYIS